MSLGFMASRRGPVETADSALKELLIPPPAPPAAPPMQAFRPQAPPAWHAPPAAVAPPQPSQPQAGLEPSAPEPWGLSSPQQQPQPPLGYEQPAAQPWGGLGGGAQGTPAPGSFETGFANNEPISQIAPLARVAPAGGRKGLFIALVVILVLFLVVAGLIGFLVVTSGCAPPAPPSASASLVDQVVAWLSAAPAPLSTYLSTPFS